MLQLLRIFIFVVQQIKANGTLMHMVAADWLKSDKREDDLAGRPGGIVQVFLENNYKSLWYYYCCYYY